MLTNGKTETALDIDGRSHVVYPISLADVGRLKKRFGPVDKIDPDGPIALELAVALAASALHMDERRIPEKFSAEALRGVCQSILRNELLGAASQRAPDIL